MGKGDSGPTQSTVTNTNLPSYARPYFEHLMSNAEMESNQPYTTYGGQRLVGATPAMDAYYRGVSELSPNNAALGGLDVTGMATNTALANANQTAGGVTSLYNPTNYNNQNWDMATAQQYMSPYQQLLTDVQKHSAMSDYGVAGLQRDTEAHRAGAYGGTRQAVNNQLSQNQLMQDLQGIQARGDVENWGQAQAQFNTDRTMGLNAAQFNDTSRQYFNTSQMDAAQQTEQLRQAASALGLNWNQLAMGGADQMGALGQLFQQGEMSRLGMVNQAGMQQQADAQRALDQQYQDFVNQRDYNRNNLSFMSGIMRGVPVSANSDVTGYAPTNPLGQAIGAGLSTYGLMGLTGSGSPGGSGGGGTG